MGVEKFSPYAVVALRTGMAALLLLLIMFVWKRKYLYIYPAGLIGCLMAGAVNGVGSIFYYIGLSKLNASVAQMLYSLYPFFLVFWLLLDKQFPSRLTIVRIIVAVLSVSLLTQAASGNIDMVGVICMLIGSAMYALHLPINQRVLYDVPAPTVTVYTLLAMSAIVIPVYFFFDHSWPAGPAPWLPVLGLTLVTFSSRLLLFLGVKHIGGMQTALLGIGRASDRHRVQPHPPGGKPDSPSMDGDGRAGTKSPAGLVRKAHRPSDPDAWHIELDPAAGLSLRFLENAGFNSLGETGLTTSN